MPFENISVKEVIPPEPKKKPKKPLPPSKWVRVIGVPEKVDIQILIEDSYKKPMFTEMEALEVARQFLKDNQNLQSIPMMAKEIKSKYVLYNVSGEKIYVFIAWRHGLEIRIMLPKNIMMEPIRTNDSSQIIGFYVFGQK